MCVYVCIYTHTQYLLMSTSVFGGTKAFSRRKPNVLKTTLSVLLKTFSFFILDDYSLVLDNVVQEWLFQQDCLDLTLSAFCMSCLGLSMSFPEGPIICGPCGSPQPWPYIWTLRSSVLFPVGLDQEEERVLSTPSYYLFPFPLLSFFANASIQPFPFPKKAVIKLRELKASTAK